MKDSRRRAPSPLWIALATVGLLFLPVITPVDSVAKLPPPVWMDRTPDGGDDNYSEIVPPQRPDVVGSEGSLGLPPGHAGPETLKAEGHRVDVGEKARAGVDSPWVCLLWFFLRGCR